MTTGNAIAFGIYAGVWLASGFISLVQLLTR